MNQVMYVAVQGHLTETTSLPSVGMILEYVVVLPFKLSLENREFSPEKPVSQ